MGALETIRNVANLKRSSSLLTVFLALVLLKYYLKFPSLSKILPSPRKFLKPFEKRSKMKVYVSNGPPSITLRMLLKALKLPHELIQIDMAAGEHRTEEFGRKNPQNQVPVLDDDGFYMSQSIAIMHYIMEKYAPDSPLYPKELKARTLVDHRLQFNMAFFYHAILDNILVFLFTGKKYNLFNVDKVHNVLKVFEIYLKRGNPKYVAGDTTTVADFSLVASVACLEAINFDLEEYPLVTSWYQAFKVDNPEIWEVAEIGHNFIKTVHESSK